MKLTTAKEHRDFFHRHHWLEVESIYTPDECASLNAQLVAALAEKMRLPPSLLPALPSNDLFLAGRDFWRDHPDMRRLAFDAQLSSLFSELTDLTIFRIGADQLLPTLPPASRIRNEPSQYAAWLSSGNLGTMFSLQGAVGGVLVNIATPSVSHADTEVPFPKNIGNALFFDAHVMPLWSLLEQCPFPGAYLLVYCDVRARYKIAPTDPHAYHLKHQGYSLNDLLNDKLNPIVMRR